MSVVDRLVQLEQDVKKVEEINLNGISNLHERMRRIEKTLFGEESEKFIAWPKDKTGREMAPVLDQSGPDDFSDWRPY